jgi:hypothetical protein
LKRINLINPKVSDKSIAVFFASLINVHSVSELCLEKMHLGKMGGEALANLFTNSASKIQSIYAYLFNDNDVICLGKALAINTTINVLHIYISDHNISRSLARTFDMFEQS